MTRVLSKDYSIAVDRELVLKGGLHDFVEMAWREVEPATFQDNWHLEEVCSHLEAVSRVEIKRLIINEPPGCTKSLLVNVLWPAWEWISRPDTAWIYASFDVSLVGRRDGTKLINLLHSPWFLERWGKPCSNPGCKRRIHLLCETNPSASNFETNAGGFRFSTSPGGKGTGRHADIIVVDDPIKPKDVLGGATIVKQQIQRVSSWWGDTMSSRQKNPVTHRRVIVMQRLHKDDLAGEMIRTGEYVQLRLPMRYEANNPCRTSHGGDRRTVDGELLFPTRHTEETVRVLEIDMGARVAAAQLQQRPTVEGGGIFKRSNWRFWSHLENVPEPCLCEKCFTAKVANAQAVTDPTHTTGRMCAPLPTIGLEAQSWDLAFKNTVDSDFVAAGTWRTYLSRYYVLDLLNSRLSYTQTKTMMTLWAKLWPRAHDKLVEDKANGPAIIDDLKLDVPGLTPVEPKGGKEARANAVSPLFDAGVVYLPHPDICPLVWVYMAQLEAFPNDVHDDLVDMTSQVLLRLKQHGEQFAAAMAAVRNGLK